MLKKYFALLLTLIVTLGLCGAAFADNERKSGLYTYEIKGNGTISITGFDWEQNAGDIYIPALIDGYSVTTIGDGAFADESVEDVVAEKPLFLGETPIKTGNEDVGVIVHLPEGITSIGDLAFFNAKIININIPSSVRYIGVGAFAGCPIDQFSIEGKHEIFATIDGSLYNKSDKSLIAYVGNNTLIPEGIVSINDYACYRKFINSSWELPSTITFIGKYAFSKSYIVLTTDMQKQQYSLLPESIYTIDDYAFWGCTFEGKDTGGKKMFDVIAENHIGDYAFAETRFINDVFSYESSLIKANTIGNHAFHRFCFDINGPTLHLHVQANKIGEYAFSKQLYETEATKSNANNTHTYIALQLEGEKPSIGQYCFDGIPVVSEMECKSWHWSGDALTIPETLTDISSNAFAHSGNVWQLDVYAQRLIIADGVKTIGDGAFQNYECLQEVTIPSTVTSIGDRAFGGCTEIKEVILPASIKKIGYAAFERTKTKLIVDPGSYAELWAQENGYNYGYESSTEDDLDWLNN